MSRVVFVTLDGSTEEADKRNLDSLMTGFRSGNDRSTLKMVAPYSSGTYYTTRCHDPAASEAERSDMCSAASCAGGSIARLSAVGEHSDVQKTTSARRCTPSDTNSVGHTSHPHMVFLLVRTL